MDELTRYRDTLTRSMENAAKGAGVRLLPGDIAHSIGGDLAISNAFVAPEHGIHSNARINYSFLRVYSRTLSDSEENPSRLLHRRTDRGAEYPRVKLVNMKVEAVYELPLRIIKTELPPDQYIAHYGDYDTDDYGSGGGWEMFEVPSNDQAVTIFPLPHNHSDRAQNDLLSHGRLLVLDVGGDCYLLTSRLSPKSHGET